MMKKSLSRYECEVHTDPTGDVLTWSGGRRVSGDPGLDDEEYDALEEEVEKMVFEMVEFGKNKKFGNSIWMLNSSSWSLRMVHLHYGNDSTVEYDYASVMFVINILPFDIHFNP
ncbi:hypothetical protein FRC03_000646 [Tulasnella sp. 419]|nr:hypothetical protein FRC03_000646 [Tulasnella sp. 419]